MKFAKNNEPSEAKKAGLSGQNNIIFVKEDDLVEEQNTVAAFKKSADGETLTKQQGMQNDIDANRKTQVKPKIPVQLNPNFRITNKAPKKVKRAERSLRARS